MSSKTVVGKSVAVIGTFPELPEDPRAIPAGFAEYAVAGAPSVWRWPRIILMGKLIASGNANVAEPLGGYLGFQGVVASKEFRVAVCIRNASVTWDESTGKIDVQCQPEYYEGYTPVNDWTFMPPWQRQTRKHDKGLKKFRDRIIYTSDERVTLNVVARVKLCWKYDMGQRLVTGHMAPWAVVKIKYSICRNGETEVEFSGSRIPSQRNYVDWGLQGVHDLRNNSGDEVRRFIEKGGCLDADVFATSTYCG